MRRALRANCTLGEGPGCLEPGGRIDLHDGRLRQRLHQARKWARRIYVALVDHALVECAHHVRSVAAGARAHNRSLEKLFARKQALRRDPRVTARPPAHVRRRKEVLSHSREPQCQRAGMREFATSLAYQADCKFDRRFDERVVLVALHEFRLQEQLAQCRANFVTGGTETLRDEPYALRIGLRRHEFQPQLAYDEFRGGRLLQQDVEYVVSLPGAAAAKDRLLARVMQARSEQERDAVQIEAPTAER